MENKLETLPPRTKYVIVDTVLLAVRNSDLWKDSCYNCSEKRLKEMEQAGLLEVELRELGDVYKFTEKVVDEIGSYVEAGLGLRVSKKGGG